MNSETAPEKDALSSDSSKPQLTTKFFRSAVLQRMATLKFGQLVMHENGKKHEFGTPHPHTNPVNLRVEDPAFFRRLALGGSIGAAEAFMNGWWTTDDLSSLLRLFARNLETSDQLEKKTARIGARLAGAYHAMRKNSRTGSKKNIAAHYDLSNDFFALFLDESMTYSNALFDNPETTLEEAQTAKLDRICRKIDLKASDHLVEIGTGWGSFSMHAAKNYGCRVTTTTISQQQFNLATERIKKAGLEDKITVVQKDYRDLSGQYDKLVSIEMIEAVGHEFFEAYFKACAGLLKPDGIMAIQAITIADQRYEQLRRTTDFIQRYIFPGSLLPSITRLLGAATSATDLRLTHLDDMTPHYAKTLNLWKMRFLAKIDEVKALGYDNNFIKMWEYYLSYCEAGFAERCTGSVQLVFSKPLCTTSSVSSSHLAQSKA